jgi:DNA-binding GntR family transcriptional regulator
MDTKNDDQNRLARRAESSKQQAQLPLYSQVVNGLEELIADDVLPRGLVLIEGPIASYYGVSRVPVRQALALLAERGLVRTFRGRGYLVARPGEDPAPLRIPFRSLDLPSRTQSSPGRGRVYEWQRVHDEIADEISECLLFGTYQIRESSLCTRFDISRTVVREVLSRLAVRGLIEKDDRSHWICGPFTAKANLEQYQMRTILELAALKDCSESGLLPDVGPMLARLDETISRPASLLPMIGRLENDLHGLMFDRCKNERLKASIVQNQLSLHVHRMFYRHFGPDASEPMLREHRRILVALYSSRVQEALAALEAHLAAAWKRSQARLKVLAVIKEPNLPDFLERMH